MPSALCYVPRAIPKQFMRSGRKYWLISAGMASAIRECCCHEGIIGLGLGWCFPAEHFSVMR